MDALITLIDKIVWQYILMYGLLCVGAYMTFITGFIQFRRFGEFLRVIVASPKDTKNGISPFQALTISLAARVGTGNLAGVAVAIYLGGAGAIFWMWIVALVGMATAYAESTLAQLYKVKNHDGQYRGGPSFYMARAIGSRGMGVAFAILLLICFGLVFSAVQSNSIAHSMQDAFGVPELASGVVIAIFTAIVIFGGIKNIASVAEKVVPLMAALYLLLGIGLLIYNIADVPAVLGLIIRSAFGLDEAVAGVSGGMLAALLNGVQRGLFSNEAGMGSAPNIAAVAVPEPHHPASQGMVQGLGVAIDTLVVSTCTAIIILLAAPVDHGPDGLTGMVLTQESLRLHIGAIGGIFIAIAILFFAFTSILGNYSYAENAMEFLGLGDKTPLAILRIAVLGMVIWGSLQEVQTVFDIANLSMGLMAIINLVALVWLASTVKRLTQDYFDQRKAGKTPRFDIEQHPDLKKGVDVEIWHTDT
ncbi:MAG: alanine/glycine:cation symporter family protein [Pseudomonadota bacterium]